MPNREAISLITPADLAPAAGFSHATAADGLVWVSGQVARDATGALVAPDDIVGQARRAFENLAATLGAAGCVPSDILKLTYYVTDLRGLVSSFGEVAQVVDSVLGGHLPAATMVGVTELLLEGALIEIDCVARAADLG